MKTFIHAWILSSIFTMVSGCKMASEDQCKDEDLSTRSDCTELLDRIPPVISSGIEIAAVTSSSIVLSWGAATDNVTSTDQLQYQLVVSDRADALDSLADILVLPRSSILLNYLSNQTSFEMTGLKAGTSYAMAVVVRDLEGNVSLYTPVVQTTWDPDQTRPGNFTWIEAKAADGQVELSWNAAEGATSYIIRRGTVSGVYATVGRAASSPFTDTGLTNELTYYYMVTAENLGGWTSAPSELSATPRGLDQTKPTLVSLTPSSATTSTVPSQVVATFSEAMKALTVESFAIRATGCSVVPSVSAVADSNNASTWTATLTSGTCADGAEIVVSVEPSLLSDLAGNTGAGSVVANTYTIDYVAPSIAFAAPSALFVRNGISVTIEADFFDAISTSLSIGTTDVALQATGSAACSASLSNISVDGARVTLSSCTGDGTVKARLAAGVLTGNASLQNAAAESGSVTVDNTGPTATLAFSDGALTPPAVIATFSEAIMDVPVTAFDLSTSVPCPGTPTISGVTSSADRKVWTASIDYSSCNNQREVIVTFDPVNITDLAGNPGTTCSITLDSDTCFVGQTLVMTPLGARPLSDLKPGEQVISYNFTTRKDEVAIIKEVTQHQVHDVSTIINDKGESLIGASRHRLLSKDGQRTQLKHAVKQGSKTVDTLHVLAPVLMFDLILDRNHNFYANGNLVESIIPLPTRMKKPGVSANFCFVRS